MLVHLKHSNLCLFFRRMFGCLQAQLVPVRQDVITDLAASTYTLLGTHYEQTVVKSHRGMQNMTRTLALDEVCTTICSPNWAGKSHGPNTKPTALCKSLLVSTQSQTIPSDRPWPAILLIPSFKSFNDMCCISSAPKSEDKFLWSLRPNTLPRDKVQSLYGCLNMHTCVTTLSLRGQHFSCNKSRIHILPPSSSLTFDLLVCF